MAEVVKANDVMDANARTKKSFSGKLIGAFYRTGPNKWDDYKFLVDDELGEVDVNPGIRIQLENDGTEFRMRIRGRVHRVRWLPKDDDPAEVKAPSKMQRAYFLTTYLDSYDDAPGIGFAAAIAKELG